MKTKGIKTQNAALALGLALAAAWPGPARSAPASEEELAAKFAEAAGQAKAIGAALRASSARASLVAGSTAGEIDGLEKALLSDDPGDSRAALSKLVALFEASADALAQKRIVYLLLVAAPGARAPAAEQGIRSMFELVSETPKLSEDVEADILKTLAERADPSGPYADAYFDTMYSLAVLK